MLIRRPDFSGGVQIKSNLDLMAKNQLLRCQNMTGETIGSLTKRKGYSKIGSQITASYDILANHEFSYGTTPTRKHLVVCDGAANSDVYVNVAGTWTAQSQSLTATAKARMTDFVDYLFFVNYSDATRSYDGSSWSTSTNVTSAPKAKFVEAYRDRLYLAYCNVSSMAYPSRVYYSSLPASDDTITWDTTNDWFYVESNDGDHITGLAKNKLYLLVFKQNSMYRYDGTFSSTSLRPVSWNLGAVSQESIAINENICMFYSRKGACLFSGAEPKIVSRPIQPIIDRVNQANLGDICAGFYGDHWLCYVGTLTSALEGDSAALTNVIIDYDISQNQWHYHVIPDAITAFGNYTSSGASLLSMGDSNGTVFRWDNGTDDDGTAIATNVRFVMHPMGPETRGMFQEIWFFGNGDLGDASWQYSIDGSTDSTAVALDDTYSHKYFTDTSIDPYGRRLEINLSESGGTAQWRLDATSVMVEPEQADIAT